MIRLELPPTPPAAAAGLSAGAAPDRGTSSPADAVGIRAANPGPFTLSGTNSWIVGRQPAWLIDPGPSLPEHLDALAAELELRGGAAAILLTHDHADHAESAAELRGRLGVPLAAARGRVDTLLEDGARIGPLQVLATPGHAPDHISFVYGHVLFSGDAVLGEGSVFIAPDPGALAGYLAALRRLSELDLRVLCPAHGPITTEVQAKLRQYVEHRLERERRLVAALDAGHRTAADLLDTVWSDAPPALRPAAAFTLAAHLDKLAAEGRLPEGVQRSALPSGLGPGAASGPSRE